MDEKPKIDLGQYRPKGIRGRYVIKFSLYILIFIALWFWYKKQNEDQKVRQAIPLNNKLNQKEIDLDKWVVEP